MAAIGVLWFVPLMLLVLAIIVLAIIFWIYMLVDSIKRKYKDENDKIVWVLVIVLLGIIGAVIYYFAVKKKY
jgi:prolipoprotein diacylglyceryltransferase